MMSYKFYHDQPRCHGNEIYGKIGYNSSSIRDISEMLTSIRGVLRDGLSNDVNQILQRPTLVAMATKIETKQTKQTPLV